MSQLDLIDDLAAKGGMLRKAMHSSDVEVIGNALEDFCGAIQAVQAVSDWQKDPILKEKLEALRPEIEQSRQLACLLADMTGQMHQMTSGKARDARQPLYGRTGARYA